ncbi:MAG: spore cortex biosynthesis protein YabQ [Lachnoclostridium sp.]|jgi:spore cortex biosynthesis protein YabQ|nr:spore cortex biosynthesis protein YabQ [Lachnoclostridium sp.]
MELIKSQGLYFLSSLIWGVIIFFLYDFLRIFRKLIPHAFFFRAIEDLVFWLVSSLLVFRMIFQRNNGILRIFFIFAFIYGMYAYQILAQDYFVKVSVRFIRFLFAPFMFVTKKVKQMIKYALRKCELYLIIKPERFYNDRKRKAENDPKKKKRNKKK